MDKVANFMPHHFNLYHQCWSRMPHYRENSEQDGSVTRNNLTWLVCDGFLIKLGGLFSCVLWPKVENTAPSIDTKRLLTFKHNILNNTNNVYFSISFLCFVPRIYSLTSKGGIQFFAAYWDRIWSFNKHHVQWSFLYTQLATWEFR